MASQSSSLAAVNTAFTPSNAAQTAALAAVNNAFAPAPATSAPASTSFNSSASGLNVPAPVSTPYTGTVQPGGSFDTSGNYTPPAAQPAAPTYNAQGVITGAAPSGSQKSANGNWIDSAGNQYTQAPAGNSSSTVGGGSQGNALPNSSGADSTFSTAMNALAPGGVPSESDFYNEVYSQLAPVIAAITGAESSAETAAYAAGTQQQNSLSASLGARGLAGSSEAIVEATNTNLATAQNVANAQQAAATALENVTQFAIPEAYTMYSDALTRNDTNAKAYVAQAQTNMSNALAGLASAGTSLTDLATSNPVEYNQLLQYAGGDPNVLAALYVKASQANLMNNGQPIVTSGNTLVYGVKGVDANGNPTVKTQTVTIPDLPTNYKVSSYSQAANGTVTYLAFPTDANGNQTVDPSKPNNGIISGTITASGGSNYTPQGLTTDQSAALDKLGLNAADKELISGIVSGNTPPPTGFGANSKEMLAVKAGLSAIGFDLSTASLDYTAMTKYVATLNSTQQVRLKQAAAAVPEMLTNVQSLYNNFYAQAPNWGISAVNSASLAAAVQGTYGQDAQNAAVQLNQQITDITADLGTIYKGGNSATDLALQTGAEQLSGSWDADTFTGAIDNINKNIGYRIQAINAVGVGGTGGQNPYASAMGVGTNTDLSGTGGSTTEAAGTIVEDADGNQYQVGADGTTLTPYSGQ